MWRLRLDPPATNRAACGSGYNPQPPRHSRKGAQRNTTSQIVRWRIRRAVLRHVCDSPVRGQRAYTSGQTMSGRMRHRAQSPRACASKDFIRLSPTRIPHTWKSPYEKTICRGAACRPLLPSHEGPGQGKSYPYNSWVLDWRFRANDWYLRVHPPSNYRQGVNLVL